MLSAFCYLLTYIFEALISKIYFSEKFELKANKTIAFIEFTASALLQFGISFIGIPNLNLITFVLCNFALCFTLFKTSFLQSLFNSILLSATMLITELCVFFTSTLFFDIELRAYETSDIALWIQTSCAKLLYFFAAYLIAKLSTKEHRKELKTSKSALLLLLPIASIILLVGIVRITEIYLVPSSVYIIFVVSTILLLYSNIIVFWVHESVIKTQNENTEFRLQKQKSELDTEYYAILQNQYENSNILIHDIKRHLLSIKDYASDSDCESINKYIENLYDEYQIKYLKKYSDNKLINAIVNRYMMACKELGITFYCDVRNIDFSFISEVNLTSILDNLLENAIEASRNSKEKSIELTIKETNENFVVFNLINSCSNKPQRVNGELRTTKSNKDIHGFGIKVIKRIARDYDGTVDYSFDADSMIFSFSVILKSK